jgi:hypothetical protein
MNPMVHLGDEAQLEAHFGPFGDSVNLDARQVPDLHRSTIGSEIVFHSLDGTPRLRGSSKILFWPVW